MFFFGHLTPNDFVIKCLDCNYTQKTWSQLYRPFHNLKALALPYLSKRATSKSPT